MEINATYIQELIKRPSESLSVEIKRWINPDTPEGMAKIVKAALALRNHNGGYLVIGFDNETLKPDIDNVPGDVNGLFHLDKIQGMISKYSSEPFEIAVEFPERDGLIYPVIVIPAGVKTMVACKSDLKENENYLIRADTVYVRSLRANNTPSTTRAGWNDWPSIIDICFDNREADIGRFLRRHLSGLTPEVLRELASTITKSVEPEVTTEDILNRYLQDSEARYQETVRERQELLPEFGAWEVALIFVGDVPTHYPNSDLLNLLDSSNPRYTGWPVWLDSRGFADKDRPHVSKKAYETFIVDIMSGWAHHIEFQRIDPKGRFYLRRALQDDVEARGPKPLTVLDFGLPVLRTAEAMAVGIAFAKAMGCDPENTVLAFAFRWTKLKGRELCSWAQHDRFLSQGRGKTAYDDEVTVFVNVPLNTPLSALSEFVNQAVQPLFVLFDGFVLNISTIEDLTRRLIERKL